MLLAPFSRSLQCKVMGKDGEEDGRGMTFLAGPSTCQWTAHLTLRVLCSEAWKPDESETEGLQFLTVRL